MLSYSTRKTRVAEILALIATNSVNKKSKFIVNTFLRKNTFVSVAQTILSRVGFVYSFCSQFHAISICAVAENPPPYPLLKQHFFI